MVKVKKSDKGDFYKRQQTWELRDLTEVDAKDASKVQTTDASFYFFTYNLVHSCSKCSYILSWFRKILSSTFTSRRCTAGWPAARLKKTPSSPAFGSWTSDTWGRRWSLWMSVLSCWKVWKYSLLTVANPAKPSVHASSSWFDYICFKRPVSFSWNQQVCAKSCLRYSNSAQKWESLLDFGWFLFINSMFTKKRIQPPLCILVCGMAFCVKFFFILTFLS